MSHIALGVVPTRSQDGKTFSSLTVVTPSSSSIPGSPNGTEAGFKVLDSNNVVDHTIWASENNDSPAATGIWLAAVEDAEDDAGAAYTSVTKPLPGPEDTPTDAGFGPRSTSGSDTSADTGVAAAEAGELDTAVSEALASGGRRLRSR